MFKTAKLLALHCITPLHCGSGSELGIVDLPIQREKHTGFPKIEGSSLKGSLREAFESKLGEDDLNVHLTFGYDSDSDKSEKIKKVLGSDNTEFAGSLGFSDARIIFFPIKSAKEVFVYATAPYILNKLKDEMELIGLDSKFLSKIPQLQSGSCIIANPNLALNNIVVLEEYSYQVINDPDINNIANGLQNLFKINNLKQKLLILSNDDFKDFVTFHTEVITRTKINNETGTVQQGALFNEEYLPAESVLYSIIFAAPVFNTVKNGFTDEKSVINFFSSNLSGYVQIGGNATLGKGIVKTTLI